MELKGEALEGASKLFKELGLPQEDAQKLVDFHAAQLKAAAEAPTKAYNDMTAEWKSKSEADPDIGPFAETKAKQVKLDISKAFDALAAAAPANREVVNDFQHAMNLTGLGDHPAFIKIMHQMSKAFLEGKAVSPGGPVAPKGPDARPPSVASALYPNLKS